MYKINFKNGLRTKARALRNISRFATEDAEEYYINGEKIIRIKCK